MEFDDHPFRRLGKRVAEAEDHVRAERRGLKEVKRDIVFLPQVYRRRVRIGRIVVGLGAVAAAATLLLFFWPSRSISVNVRGRSLAEGDFISSKAGRKTLEFSDGSKVSLEAESGVRVRALNDNGAVLLLESGAVSADVRHAQGTSWRIEAGPYLIQVTGTRFRAAWHPGSEEFDLTMEEGRVRVKGPLIPEEKVVSTGERIIVQPELRRVTFIQGGVNEKYIVDAETTNSPNAFEKGGRGDFLDTSQPEIEAAGRESETDTKTAPLVRKQANEPTWRRLLSEGKYAAVLKVAQNVDLTAMLEEAGATDLVGLGDAARYTGDLALAMRIYKAVRNRFAGTPYASNAAFTLGLTAMAGQGGCNAAVVWFRRVFTERSKKDGLAREASGRILECLEQSGDAAAAADEATRYLSLWPKGPHAEDARRVLGR